MTVCDRVLKVIAEESHREVRPEQLDTTFEELGVDSLDKVCILFGLEKEFSISIPEEQARRFSTVRQVIEHLSAPGETSAGSAAAS